MRSGPVRLNVSGLSRVGRCCGQAMTRSARRASQTNGSCRTIPASAEGARGQASAPPPSRTLCGIRSLSGGEVLVGCVVRGCA